MTSEARPTERSHPAPRLRDPGGADPRDGAARAERSEDESVVRRPVGSGRQRPGAATLDPRILDAIVRRIVEIAQPEKIILFGSAARGEMTRHSDVDLLVIKDGADGLDLMGQIYRRLSGVGAAVDVVVVSPRDVERYGDSHALVIKPALREGRVVYESVTEAKYAEAVEPAEAVVRWAEGQV